MTDPADLPTRHQVRSACQVATLLDGSRTSMENARDLYRTSPDELRYSIDDLLVGQELLVGAGVLLLDGDDLVATQSIATLARLDEETAALALLARLLERRPPTWLRGAARGETIVYELIPDSTRQQLVDLFPALAHGEAVLRAAARSTELRPAQSAAQAGRDLVLDACRKQLSAAGHAEHLEHVVELGELAAGLGYDVVAPRIAGGMRKLAVHTTRKVGWRAELQLTRTEVEAGRANDDWALVVCTHDTSGEPSVAGWCNSATLESLMPHDEHPHCHWALASLMIIGEALAPGLPSA